MMKKEILLEILKVTKKQEEALKGEDVDRFEDLLHQRQGLMDQLDLLHENKPEYKLQKEEQVLNEIIQVDTSNKQEYYRQYKEVQEKLKKLRSQKKVGEVYLNPYERSQEEGIFFDKK